MAPSYRSDEAAICLLRSVDCSAGACAVVVLHEVDKLTKDVMGLSHTVSKEMPSMTTIRQEKGELNHNLCHSPPHVVSTN